MQFVILYFNRDATLLNVSQHRLRALVAVQYYGIGGISLSWQLYSFSLVSFPELTDTIEKQENAKRLLL